MPYVVATLTSDNLYRNWKPLPKDAKAGLVAIHDMEVLVHGGANVMGRLHTPQGVLTSITDAQAEFLAAHPMFKQQAEAGYVKIIHQPVVTEAEADKIAQEDLTDRDASAPLNEEKGDFEVGGRAGGVAPKHQKQK